MEEEFDEGGSGEGNVAEKSLHKLDLTSKSTFICTHFFFPSMPVCLSASCVDWKTYPATTLTTQTTRILPLLFDHVFFFVYYNNIILLVDSKHSRKSSLSLFLMLRKISSLVPTKALVLYV
eukprot:g24949.t1